MQANVDKILVEFSHMEIFSTTPIASSSYFSRATQFFYIIKTWNVISFQFSHSNFKNDTHIHPWKKKLVVEWNGRNVTMMEAMATTAEKEEKKTIFSIQ